MKRALIIRHTPYEGIAGFRQPIEDAGYVIDRVDVTDCAFATTDFLSPDLVVAMGGPMGVHERIAYPWIDCEVNRLSIRIGRGLPTLGVCLGAQMVAAALGAKVYPGPVREVGFAPVQLTDAGAASPLRHIADVPVLHWHGDTFDVPDNVEVLARTASYVQGFRRGRHLLALQCHPEMGEDPRIDAWLRDEAYVESAGTTVAALRADYEALGPATVRAGRRLIAEWLAGLE
ncbi:glutamine amidotransferase [Sphingomonas naphthae]|uniref:Glutamine amidotransferase n=1 Tax=Sphingomonas naphthae TaxID=1813468 RepID=A0ABY7TJ93_9SPHN|nr:glutamine amidotransferase [Sphingomonas naphthae]WCT71964.1 glutamine amidotransferase [Sphingomonas naphthae]